MNGVASGWQLVTSGTPQGSILGPVLFNGDRQVKCTLSEFADHTKLKGTVGSLKSREVLQRDLNTLTSWGAMTSCMKFNKGTCQILHLGQDSPDYL